MHPRVGENIEKNPLKVFKIYFQKNAKIKKTQKNTKKNNTDAKHPHMFTYKMTVVSAEEATSNGRTNK